MEIDREMVRQGIADLDEEIMRIEVHKRRLEMVRRDLLIAIGARKPMVERIDTMKNPDGTETDLKKYRFKLGIRN